MKFVFWVNLVDWWWWGWWLELKSSSRYLFFKLMVTCLEIYWFNERKRFQAVKKERSRRYTAQTITDADYADNMALLVNTPTQAETLLHSLEQAAGGIGLHVNADKTEYTCFNQRGDISTVKVGLGNLLISSPTKEAVSNQPTKIPTRY